MFGKINSNLGKVKKDIYLAQLRDSDPKLFNELYKGLLYSVIVQKSRQPEIITKEQFEEPEFLSNGSKNPEFIPPVSKTKYINVTSGGNAYYSCHNNKLNKEIYYIIGKHPEGYCLPSCKPIGRTGQDD